MRLFGLIGYPLSHSFSEKYFTQKFEKEKLTACRYELFPIRSISELPDLLKARPELRGLNVTIPYKQSVLTHLQSVSNIPGGLGACNCIKIENGELAGYNTDCTAFEKSLAPLLRPWHKKALILGNGGSSKAVVWALNKLTITFDIVSRKLHDGSTLTYGELNGKLIKDHLIIINTTPLGMYPRTKECPEIPYHFITGRHLFFDLVYNPVKSLFLQKGEEHGATIINGEEMLMLQAEESWRIWNS